MRNIVSGLLMIMLFLSQGNAQCEINNVNSTIYGCGLTDSFYVDINFDFTEVGENGFTLLGNSIFHGTFQYAELPITLGPFPANCATPWEYIIRDVDDPICSEVHVLGTVCCSDECVISDFEPDPLLCTGESSYLLFLDFQIEGELGGEFELFVNGEKEGNHPYSMIPGSVPVPWDGTTLQEVVVCDRGNSICCDTMTIFSPCACFIDNVSTDLIDCSEEDSMFSVAIDFDALNVSDSFTLGGNNTTYGLFSYSDLPVVIGPFPMDTTDYQFAIFDEGDDVFCFGVGELGVVDSCEPPSNCNFSNVNFIPHNCGADSLFLIDLSFDVEDSGGVGVLVEVNGEFLEQIPYGQAFYTLGPLLADCTTIYDFTLTDLDIPECTMTTSLSTPVCCDPDICNDEYEINLSDISCNMGMVTASIDLEYEILPGTATEIFVEGELITEVLFLDYPLDINFLWNFSDPYLIEVCLKGISDCCNELELEAFDCVATPVCEITNLFVEPSPCDDDGNFFGILSFDVKDPGASGFTVVGNGNNYGTFNYGESTYEIGPNNGDCETIFEFVVLDIENQNCLMDFEFTDPVCCLQPACKLFNLAFTEIGCFNDNLIFTIDFDYSLVDSVGFDLFIDDEQLSFHAYDELPLTTLVSEYDQSDGFVSVKVCEDDNPDCCEEGVIMLSEIDKGCFFDDISYDYIDCDADEFYVNISFDYGNGGSFSVSNDDTELGLFSYEDLPITLGPFLTDSMVNYNIVFTDDEQGCQNSLSLPGIECTQVATEDTHIKETKIWSTNDQLVWSADLDIEQIDIYDLNGRKIFSKQINSNLCPLDITTSGLFLVKLSKQNFYYSQLIYLSF